MKTERRHELQTNVLADHLGKWILAAKPYAKIGVVALIVAALAALAWQVFSSQSASGRGKAWDEFEAARQQYMAAGQALDSRATNRDTSEDAAMVAAVSQVDLVIDKYKEQPVAHWAQLLLGSHYQSAGSRQLFFDREKARETLQKAAEYFRAATESKQQDLSQRAYFGLALALESQGELDQAIEAYGNVDRVWPNGPLSATARDYAKRLEKPDSREFYVSYEQQDPSRARAVESDDPLGNVIDDDSFKIPGVDDDAGTSDELGPGEFIPKVNVPGEDFPGDDGAADDAAPDDASDPPLPEDADGAKDSPADELPKEGEKELAKSPDSKASDSKASGE